MVLRNLALTAVGAVAGVTAFTVFRNSGIGLSVVAFATVAWLLWRFTGAELLLDSGKYFLRPDTLFMLALGLGITYLALELEPVNDSLTGGLGIGFLGAALAMLLFKYWSIGS